MTINSKPVYVSLAICVAVGGLVSASGQSNPGAKDAASVFRVVSYLNHIQSPGILTEGSPCLLLYLGAA
jgi:hypothetical protein